MGGRSVPGLTRIDHHHATPSAAQDQSGGQSGGATADNRNVVIVHDFRVTGADSSDNGCCRFREPRGSNDQVATRPDQKPEATTAAISQRSSWSGRGCARFGSSAA